jgi:streptogramin lyase
LTPCLEEESVGGCVVFPLAASRRLCVARRRGARGNKIGRVTTLGAFTEYPVPNVNSGPGSITTGADGARWFTENNSHKIGRI